jgi:hypothetical protein
MWFMDDAAHVEFRGKVKQTYITSRIEPEYLDCDVTLGGRHLAGVKLSFTSSPNTYGNTPKSKNVVLFGSVADLSQYDISSRHADATFQCASRQKVSVLGTSPISSSWRFQTTLSLASDGTTPHSVSPSTPSISGNRDHLVVSSLFRIPLKRLLPSTMRSFLVRMPSVGLEVQNNANGDKWIARSAAVDVDLVRAQHFPLRFSVTCERHKGGSCPWAVPLIPIVSSVKNNRPLHFHVRPLASDPLSQVVGRHLVGFSPTQATTESLVGLSKGVLKDVGHTPAVDKCFKFTFDDTSSLTTCALLDHDRIYLGGSAIDFDGSELGSTFVQVRFDHVDDDPLVVDFYADLPSTEVKQDANLRISRDNMVFNITAVDTVDPTNVKGQVTADLSWITEFGFGMNIALFLSEMGTGGATAAFSNATHGSSSASFNLDGVQISWVMDMVVPSGAVPGSSVIDSSFEGNVQIGDFINAGVQGTMVYDKTTDLMDLRMVVDDIADLNNVTEMFRLNNTFQWSVQEGLKITNGVNLFVKGEQVAITGVSFEYLDAYNSVDFKIQDETNPNDQAVVDLSFIMEEARGMFVELRTLANVDNQVLTLRGLMDFVEAENSLVFLGEASDGGQNTGDGTVSFTWSETSGFQADMTALVRANGDTVIEGSTRFDLDHTQNIINVFADFNAFGESLIVGELDFGWSSATGGKVFLDITASLFGSDMANVSTKLDINTSAEEAELIVVVHFGSEVSGVLPLKQAQSSSSDSTAISIETSAPAINLTFNMAWSTDTGFSLSIANVASFDGDLKLDLLMEFVAHDQEEFVLWRYHERTTASISEAKSFTVVPPTARLFTPAELSDAAVAVGFQWHYNTPANVGDLGNTFFMEVVEQEDKTLQIDSTWAFDFDQSTSVTLVVSQGSTTNTIAWGGAWSTTNGNADFSLTGTLVEARTGEADKEVARITSTGSGVVGAPFTLVAEVSEDDGTKKLVNATVSGQFDVSTGFKLDGTMAAHVGGEAFITDMPISFDSNTVNDRIFLSANVTGEGEVVTPLDLLIEYAFSDLFNFDYAIRLTGANNPVDFLFGDGVQVMDVDLHKDADGFAVELLLEQVLDGTPGLHEFMAVSHNTAWSHSRSDAFFGLAMTNGVRSGGRHKNVTADMSFDGPGEQLGLAATFTGSDFTGPNATSGPFVFEGDLHWSTKTDALGFGLRGDLQMFDLVSNGTADVSFSDDGVNVQVLSITDGESTADVNASLVWRAFSGVSLGMVVDASVFGEDLLSATGLFVLDVNEGSLAVEIKADKMIDAEAIIDFDDLNMDMHFIVDNETQLAISTVNDQGFFPAIPLSSSRSTSLSSSLSATPSVSASFGSSTSSSRTISKWFLHSACVMCVIFNRVCLFHGSSQHHPDADHVTHTNTIPHAVLIALGDHLAVCHALSQPQGQRGVHVVPGRRQRSGDGPQPAAGHVQDNHHLSGHDCSRCRTHGVGGACVGHCAAASGRDRGVHQHYGQYD